jgi:hypothetical protein
LQVGKLLEHVALPGGQSLIAWFGNLPVIGTFDLDHGA